MNVGLTDTEGWLYVQLTKLLAVFIFLLSSLAVSYI